MYRIAAALATLPDADRAAVIAHVESLASMTPAKRAALLTLTQ